MSAPNDGRPTVIVVAGEAQKGKTTALNNIFGTNFEAGPDNNTTVREVRRDGRSYILVDTPGFGSRNIPDKNVKQFISSAIRGLDFTLLFCLPVNSGNIDSEANRNILVNLQNCLHDQIWEKCVLLLTFSDDLVRNTTDSEHYKQAIAERSASFKDLLNSTFRKEYTVNTVFDYQNEYTRQNSGFPGIVAVPVALNSNELDRNPDIIPGIPATVSWSEVALDEINTKIAPLQGELTAKNFKAIVATVGSTLAGGAAGAGAGSGIGVAVGVVGGPIGMAVGAAIGGVAGAVTGLFSGLTIGAAASYHAWMKVKPDDQIRRLRDRIPR